MNLIYFTNSFPYDDQLTEIPFLQNEIPILSKEFNICIVPVRNEGKKSILDNKIEVINTLAEDLRKTRNKRLIIKLIKSFKYIAFIKEIIKCRKLRDLTNLVIDTNDILTFYNWAKNNRDIFKKNKLIAYTYWSTAITSGLIYYRKKMKLDFKIISRAHRVDLFIELRGFIPYYYHRLKYLDKLFLISQSGRNYLAKKFSEFNKKYVVSYLGTINTNISFEGKKSNTILIVSCSVLNKRKRVDIILKSLWLLAERNPDINFKWVHLGGGPLMEELKHMMLEKNVPNLTIDIKGNLANEEIHLFYKNNFVHCFVHASESEGLPVSFMEAQSYGIPIVSKNVGGIYEIVTKNTGILIDPSADNNEIVNAIEKIVFNEKLWQLLSENAKKNWKMNFNALRNYEEFSNELKKLL